MQAGLHLCCPHWQVAGFCMTVFDRAQIISIGQSKLYTNFVSGLVLFSIQIEHFSFLLESSNLNSPNTHVCQSLTQEYPIILFSSLRCIFIIDQTATNKCGSLKMYEENKQHVNYQKKKKKKEALLRFHKMWCFPRL